MEIRNAKNSDEEYILDFCQNTFSWGDYIEHVWSFWIKEGNLFVAEEKIPVGMCHAFFSKNQVWIEGIRVNPMYRRNHVASKLISYVEHIANQKNTPFSYMLIDSENIPSLSMAKKLDYKIFETWNFYSLTPEMTHVENIKIGYIPEKISLNQYVQSWRWLPLDNEIIHFLENNKQIISSDSDNNPSFSIITESEHFEKTMIVTFYSGSEKNSLYLLSFLQNYAYENDFTRIQILSKGILPDFKNLEKKLSFNLMKKLLN